MRGAPALPPRGGGGRPVSDVPHGLEGVPHAARTVSRRRAAALGAHAEAVCRRYLPHGRKQGRYWIAGDLDGARGRSLFVRLRGPGVPGKWTEYVAVLVMLRIRDWVHSHRRSTSSKQHNVSAFVLNELAESRASPLTDAMTDRLKADGRGMYDAP